MTFFTPIQYLFYTVGGAVLFDTIFAVIVSIRLNGIKSIKSHLMFNLAIKTFFYMATMMLGFAYSDKFLDGDIMGVQYFIPKVIGTIWTLIELKSMDETNMKLGKKSVVDSVKSGIDYIKTIKKDISEIIGK